MVDGGPMLPPKILPAPCETGAVHIWVPAFPTEQVRGLKAHGTAQEGDAALIYLNAVNAGEH